ncbi:MAG: thioesterase [Deltaproteobacteria bacterium]|nr:thioesterase [Deltaproteobacteria bacterium]
MNWVRTETFETSGLETGPDRRIPLQNLCGLMEEAAALHAAELGFSMEELARRGLAWALTMRWIEFDKPPCREEGEALNGEDFSRIQVKTWPVSIEGLRYRRDFLISRGGGVLARAVTDWVVLNLQSRQAERIPEFIKALQPENPERVMNISRPRLPSQENAPELAVFAVRESDIDRNNHVNNACFAKWAVESAPAEISSRRWLKSFLILHRAEGRPGDTVTARGSSHAEGVFGHGLFRLSDGQELVRARSIWGDISSPTFPKNPEPRG